MKVKIIGYWTATALVAFSMVTGGLTEIVHQKDTVDGMVHILGYPLYFLTILGVWKVLGAIAILIPGFPRLKEWAYAGIFFDATGAVASHAFAGDYGAHGFHILITLILTVLTVASWALRPESRVLGVLFPARP
jgi:uncharacterized membrane protein YphA (DoxX/SURF4 family)